METKYDKETDTYYQRRVIGNQTIELGMNYYMDNSGNTKSWWNIYITIFNKRKDKYSNMDKKRITGTNPLANVVNAIDMFYEVEAYLLQNELMPDYKYDEVVIFCTWVDNRRRDAYYKVLSRFGYYWGTIDGEKCIMKTYKKSDINPLIKGSD